MDMRETLCESRNFSSSLEILKYRSRIINPICLPHVAKPEPGSEPACPSEPGCDCRGKLQSLAADSAPSEWLTCQSALTHYSLLGFYFPSCLHATLTWKLITSLAAAGLPPISWGYSKRAHSLHLASVFICKTVALFSFTVFLRFLSPLIQLQEELVSAKAQSGSLELTSGENKH